MLSLLSGATPLAASSQKPVSSLVAQAPEGDAVLPLAAPPIPPPPTPAGPERSLLLPPPDEVKENGSEEVLRPSPFSSQELRILQSAETMPIDKLVDIILVYERLSNQAMLDGLVRALVSRAPNHPEAMRLKSAIEVQEIVRDPGYIDSLLKKLEAGGTANEVEQDVLVDYSYNLSNNQDTAEAVRVLRLLEKTTFPPPAVNSTLLALASALRANRDYAAAEQMLVSISGDHRQAEATRQEANRLLPFVKLDQRIQSARGELLRDMERGVALAETILRESPTYPPALDFWVECLTYAGRQQEAIARLEEMRATWPAPTFLFLPSLGYAFFADKQFDAARAAFGEVMADPSFTSQTRGEARTMSGKISLAATVNEGLEAMNRRDFATANEVLARLERDFPGDDEVLGYRAALLARQERSTEALELLHAAKEKAISQRRGFTQQDVLADVFLVRKEFAAARSALQEILDQPGYDFPMKAAAKKGLTSVDREETIFRGYNDLSWGRNSQARVKEAQAAALSTPQDKDMPLFQADLLLAERRAAEARDKFEEVREKSYPNQPFPGMNGLAASNMRLGEWEKAHEQYREAATGEGYLPQERFEALPQMRATAALIKPQLGVEGRFLSEVEGEALRLQATWQSAWSRNWRASASAREDWISLSSASVFGPRSTARAEGEAALLRRLPNGWFAEGSAGGSQEGELVYGARVGQFENGGYGWALAWSGNARSTWSLPLELLDGREDRLSLSFGGKLNPRMRFDLAAYLHRVRIGGDTLGDGYGVDGSFNVILQTETMNGPEISVGWFGTFSRFNGDTGSNALAAALEQSNQIALASLEDAAKEAMDALVDPRVHRHGIVFGMRRRLGDDVNVYAQGGGYYDVDESEAGLTGLAGIEWYLSESALFYAELRYDSSGRGASADGGVWEAVIGGKITF